MKFFIYKGTGGLFHNLSGLCTAINYSIKNNYVLIIDFKGDGFDDKFTDFFTIKKKLTYYDHYDKVPETITYKSLSLEDIKNNIAKCRGTPRNRFYTLKDVVVSKIEKLPVIVYARNNMYDLSCNIMCNDTIYNKLKQENHIKKSYISVHFRNTDIKNNIRIYIKKIRHLINRTGIKNIYLASDDSKAYNIIKNIPGIILHRNTIPPDNIRNLHFSSDNSYKQVYDSIRDIYFILLSTYFIPSNNSGYSKSIMKMIRSRKYLIPVNSRTIIF
jgi:hypothetical protein